jgi:hypothetical protein
VSEARYRTAARAYFAYGLVYYVGGLYLVRQGVGVMGAMEGRSTSTLAFWAVTGLVPLLLVPYLLTSRRGWFERWMLTRRDFARLIAILLAFRAWKVSQVVLQPSSAFVPTPWGGTISFPVGAAIFLIATVAALAAVIRAAWGRDELSGRGDSPGARDFK